MNKIKRFFGNTLILSIGTLGSKMIQYLLLPYYTNILSTTEYGVVDNLQNITTLLVPIISLTISEGIFRYALDKNYDKEKVFSNGMFINICGVLFSLFAGGIVFAVSESSCMKAYAVLVMLNVTTNFMRANCSQYMKAIENTLLYTIDSILVTFCTVSLNILFLSVFDMGVAGYMLGYIFGNTISFVFLIATGKLYQAFSFKYVSAKMCKTLIWFCIPLIPNTICWWVSNCSDRFMITYFMDASANGLYALSYKVPTILTILVGIFIQAWQILANQSSEDNDISVYYSLFYKYLDVFVACLAAVTIVFSKFIIHIIAAPGYFEAWKYVPALVYGIYFFSKAQLLGTVYTTFHKTSMAFVTNFIAAVINIVGNFFLINRVGVLGAAIATAVSYMILCWIRQGNAKRYIDIQYEHAREIVIEIILLLETVAVTWFDQNLYLAMIGCILVFVVNAKAIKQIIMQFLNLVRKK